MAETDLFSWFNVSATTDGVMITIYLLVILACVIAITWFIITVMQYKHKVMIIYKTSHSNIIIEDKARIVKDEDEKEVWKLWKLKDSMPPPPKDARSITKNGKFFVIASYSEEEGYLFRMDKDYHEQIAKDKLTTNQKMFYVNQFKKAQANRRKSWQDVISNAVPYLALVIIVVCLFIFWGEIAEPSLEMARINTQTTEKLNQLISSIDKVCTEGQDINPEEIRPD
jgi:hypothetical protein